MKKIRRTDTAFRWIFVVLVVAAIGALFWQCRGLPAGPSRVGWPSPSTSKP